MDPVRQLMEVATVTTHAMTLMTAAPILMKQHVHVKVNV